MRYTKGKTKHKKNASINHFSKKLKARFNIDLDKNKLEYLIARIKKHDYPILRKQSNRVSIYKAVIDGKEIPVVYDKKRKVPITALKWYMFNNLDEFIF